MHKKINRFTDLMSWLAEQYKDVLEHTAKCYPFRIVSERTLPKTGETIFTIQFVGKSTCPKINAHELANDDDLIQGFSPADVKRILDATITKTPLKTLGQQQTSSEHRVLSKSFNQGTDKPTYLIEFIDENNCAQTKTLPLGDFIKRKDLLKKFNKKDIYDIAYTAGVSSILQEQKEVLELSEK
jgi:hypothetical protein